MSTEQQDTTYLSEAVRKRTEGTIRFVHPVQPRGSVTTEGVDLPTALEMARNGGDIEVWRAEYRKWFMLIPDGSNWRVDLLNSFATHYEQKGAEGERERLEALTNGARHAERAIDGHMKFLMVSGMAEESLKLYESCKPLAEARAEIAAAFAALSEKETDQPQEESR